MHHNLDILNMTPDWKPYVTDRVPSSRFESQKSPIQVHFRSWEAFPGTLNLFQLFPMDRCVIELPVQLG
jgi:hypothetical protein